MRQAVDAVSHITTASEGWEYKEFHPGYWARLHLENGMVVEYQGVYFTREEYAELEYDRLQDIRMDAETPEPEDKDDEKEKD
jgi:hypothetical protein